MTHYSCSSITGYKSHLPTKEIRLPLRYPDAVSSGLSPHDQFTQKLANSGEIIDFKNYASFVDLVVVDVLNDLSEVTLTPLVFQNQIPLDLQKIVVKLPHKLVSGNCVSVNIQESGNDDVNLVIDLLDEKYLFVTVSINLKDFICGQGNLFALKDFKSWGHISVPYSFELKSVPYYMSSFDHNNCVISLKDGTLVHFQRPDPLQDFVTFNFSEPSKAHLGFFNRLFTDASHGNTPSKNCATDIIIQDNRLVVLTIDKTIKVFDIDSHNFLLSSKAADDGSSLSSVPNKYLDIIKNDCILFHTSNSFESNDTVQFHVWSSRDLSPLGTINIQTPPESVNKWFVQDFTVGEDANGVKLNVLWKYNSSSILMSYTVDLDVFNVLEFTISDLEDSGDDFLQDFDQGYYKEKVLNGGSYEHLILKTSVDIIRDRLGLPPSEELLIQETINKLAEQQDGEPWFMMYALCEEYSKLSKESLSLAVKNGTIISLQTNGVGIYRSLSYVEKFVDQNDQFNQILQTIDVKLSNKTVQKVYQYVISNKQLTGENLAYISDDLLNGKFDTDIAQISQVLDNYPNVLEVIKTLIEGPEYEQLGFETNVSIVEKLYYVVSFKNIIKVHKNLLIRLLILFSKFEDNETLVGLSNSILQKFSDFKLFDKLFTSNYEKSILFHQMLVKGDVINKYNYLNAKIKERDYLLSIITRLMQLQQQDVVIKDLLDKIDHDSNKYLVGLIYLTNKDPKCIPLLTYANYQDFDKSQKLTPELNEFLSKEVQNESQYYHQLSSLISNNGIQFINEAVELELSAINSLEAEGSTEAGVLRAKYYDNIFDLALQSFDINKLLLALRNSQASPNFKASLTKFIKRLIDERKFHTLLEIAETSPDVAQFLNDNFKIIDLIFSELADSEPIMKSITIFEIAYSWRINHHSKRGALEALYAFITRFEAHKPLDANTTKVAYLKILEFYLVILNGLKSFKNDKDKWILRYSSKNEIVTLTDLTKEYSNYLKKINN